ncbi:MAG TPA: hypothetical protein VGB60_09580 [Brevundimonas sp.]
MASVAPAAASTKPAASTSAPAAAAAKPAESKGFLSGLLDMVFGKK